MDIFLRLELWVADKEMTRPVFAGSDPARIFWKQTGLMVARKYLKLPNSQVNSCNEL